MTCSGFAESLHWYDSTRVLARLATCTNVPLASDKSELHSWAVRGLIDLGAIRYVQFDCTRAGGITEGLRIGTYALAHGLQVALHHDLQVHGHLAAAMPHGYCVEGFPRLERDPIWYHLYCERPELEAGVSRLTDKPGLGLEIDWKMVERWQL